MAIRKKSLSEGLLLINGLDKKKFHAYLNPVPQFCISFQKCGLWLGFLLKFKRSIISFTEHCHCFILIFTGWSTKCNLSCGYFVASFAQESIKVKTTSLIVGEVRWSLTIWHFDSQQNCAFTKCLAFFCSQARYAIALLRPKRTRYFLPSKPTQKHTQTHLVIVTFTKSKVKSLVELPSP